MPAPAAPPSVAPVRFWTVSLFGCLWSGPVRAEPASRETLPVGRAIIHIFARSEFWHDFASPARAAPLRAMLGASHFQSATNRYKRQSVAFFFLSALCLFGLAEWPRFSPAYVSTQDEDLEA